MRFDMTFKNGLRAVICSLLYGKYQLAAGNLVKLLKVEVMNPVNCMKGVMDKLGIPRKYAAEAVDLFMAQYGEGPCTEHERQEAPHTDMAKEPVRSDAAEEREGASFGFDEDALNGIMSSLEAFKR